MLEYVPERVVNLKCLIGLTKIFVDKLLLGVVEYLTQFGKDGDTHE